MQDNFDYTGFLSKNKLGPYAKTKALNENYIDLRPINEFVEENAQEDEDGSQVTKGQIYPEPIEVLEMGSNGALIRVRKPNGEEEDVEFELGPEIEEVDPPYGYEGTIYGEIDGEEYGIAVSLVDMGGAGYDMDLSYDGLTFLEGKVQESNDNVDAGKIGFGAGEAPKTKQNSAGNHNMMDKQSDTREPAAGSIADQIRKSKGLNEEDNDGYQEFLSALSKIVGLKKEGIITEDEYSKIMDACLPIYNRLKGQDNLDEKLKGGQKKLDKDGDGKISGNDFKMMKK
jgi:hypothetical protein